jgi:hypothetical protein
MRELFNNYQAVSFGCSAAAIVVELKTISLTPYNRLILALQGDSIVNHKDDNMKKVTTIAVGFLFAAVAQFSAAGTHWEMATIQKISSNKYGEVQIKLDKVASTACDNKQILRLPNESERVDKLLSKAMFAYTTGEKIHIYGTGQCDGEFEVVRTIKKS